MKDDDLIADRRRRIDALDRRILEALNERSRCVLAIGAAKRRLDRPLYDPAREADILRQVLEANGGPLRGDAIRRLFERILDESRRMERLENDPAAKARDGGKV